MTDHVPRETVLRNLRVALAEAEQAIQSHPPKTADVYTHAAREHEAGLQLAEETEWSRSLGLTLEELALTHRYLFAVAFISAWWLVAGNKTKRGEAAKVALQLVIAAGFPLNDAVAVFTRFEGVLLDLLREAQPRPKKLGCALLLLVAACIALWKVTR